MDKGIRILLVEDNRADADLVCEMIQERQIGHVEVARDGEEALRLLGRSGGDPKRPRPDLILLDLNLPKLHGREVLRSVKLSEELKRIPILVLTSSAAERDVVESYDLGANSYLQKPTDFGHLTSLMTLIDEFWVKTVKLPKKQGV